MNKRINFIGNTTINKIAHKNKTMRLFQFNLFEFISNIKNLIEN